MMMIFTMAFIINAKIGHHNHISVQKIEELIFTNMKINGNLITENKMAHMIKMTVGIFLQNIL